MMIKLQYACTCLVIISSLILTRFHRHFKEQILSEIEKYPGTPIMPQQEMLEETCVAKKFNQTIVHENPKTIANKFCYGQRNSFHIPQATEEPMEMCFTCQPDVTFAEQVVLDCVKDNQLYEHRVTVQRIHSCRCNQCQ